MDTNQLIAFQRVVREGTFSRAALSLDLGQPALSARIRALEDQLGGPLFKRGRRVQLTPLGQSFLPYARRALETLDEGARVARLAEQGGRGRVSVGCLGSLAGALLGPAIAELMRTLPGTECHVRSADHEFVLQLLWDGVVELGIVAWPCSDATAGELTALSVFSEPVVLVVHPQHPFARKRSLRSADFDRCDTPLMRLRWSKTHDERLLKLAERTGGLVEVAMQSARHLVLDGSAIGFFPRSYVAEDLDRGTLLEVKVRDLPTITRDSALVRRDAAPPPGPASQELVRILEAQASRCGFTRPRKRRR